MCFKTVLKWGLHAVDSDSKVHGSCFLQAKLTEFWNPSFPYPRLTAVCYFVTVLFFSQKFPSDPG